MTARLPRREVFIFAWPKFEGCVLWLFQLWHTSWSTMGVIWLLTFNVPSPHWVRVWITTPTRQPTPFLIHLEKLFPPNFYFFPSNLFSQLSEMCVLCWLCRCFQKEREQERETENEGKKERKNVFDNYSFVNAEALLLLHNNSAVMESDCVHECVCVCKLCWSGTQKSTQVELRWASAIQIRRLK